METIKLEHFCALVETGSLTKAAKVMGITHPGIHKSIRSLEEELQLTLTIPKGRGLEITESGQIIYEKAKSILYLTARLNNNQNKEKKLKIGHNEVLNYLIPSFLLKELGINISFHERCPGDIEPSITDGTLNYGLTLFPRKYHGIEHEVIGELELGLFSLKRQKLTKDTVFITPTSNYENIERDFWKESQFPRQNTINTNMLSIGVELLYENSGCLFIPIKMASILNKRHSRKLYQFTLPENLKNKATVYLCRPIGKSVPVELKKAIKLAIKN